MFSSSIEGKEGKVTFQSSSSLGNSQMSKKWVSGSVCQRCQSMCGLLTKETAVQCCCPGFAWNEKSATGEKKKVKPKWGGVWRKNPSGSG